MTGDTPACERPSPVPGPWRCTIVGMKTLMILLIAAALAVTGVLQARDATGNLCELVEAACDLHGHSLAEQLHVSCPYPLTPEIGKEINAVSVSSAMTVEKFESKSLHRTFDNIVFGSIDGAAPTAHASAPSPMKDVGDVKVDKAEGSDAKTIAEIWASKGALKDHRVVVRGKVVKFLPSIMGKNWMHVRDGSGTRGKGDDDIAVISDDQTTVGSVVTLTGTVRLDKDFGAGYQYPVIIDGAKLK